MYGFYLFNVSFISKKKWLFGEEMRRKDYHGVLNDEDGLFSYTGIKLHSVMNHR
jgi:hypothetical protein